MRVPQAVDGKIISLLGRGLARAFPGCFNLRVNGGHASLHWRRDCPAFRQNFVKVTPDALMNGECGISATYSAVGELAGPNGPLIWEVRLRPGATLLKLGDGP